LTVALAVVLIASISLSGCKAEPEVVIETVPGETVVVTEIVEVEVTAAEEGAYDYYEMLREVAKKSEAYPDAPAAGKTLAFTNIHGRHTFL